MTYNCHCEESFSKDDEAIQELAMTARMTGREAGMTLSLVFQIAVIPFVHFKGYLSFAKKQLWKYKRSILILITSRKQGHVKELTTFVQEMFHGNYPAVLKKPIGLSVRLRNRYHSEKGKILSLQNHA